MSFHSLLLQTDLAPKPQAGGGGGGGTTQQSSGPAGGGAPSMGGNSMMLMLPLLMLGFIFIMNSRQKKTEEKERASLKRGDRVVTQSGLIGELVEFDDKIAKVQIAPGVKVQMLIASVSPMKGKPEVAEEAKTDKAPQAVEKK